MLVGREKVGSKNMKIQRFWSLVARHGLIFGGNSSYHLQEAFGSVPGPPGPQKRAKSDKQKVKKVKNQIFVVFSAVFFPSKGRIFCCLGSPLWSCRPTEVKSSAKGQSSLKESSLL